MTVVFLEYLVSFSAHASQLATIIQPATYGMITNQRPYTRFSRLISARVRCFVIEVVSRPMIRSLDASRVTRSSSSSLIKPLLSHSLLNVSVIEALAVMLFRILKGTVTWVGSEVTSRLKRVPHRLPLDHEIAASKQMSLRYHASDARSLSIKWLLFTLSLLMHCVSTEASSLR
ncbi:hypothetical protein F5Y18DRAFT_125822 [Xylariaceae sp. FL1019]|nr:hypothetical protein F5Y18DRAFT_125822 [Xylariaceae sp. FL1019]